MAREKMRALFLTGSIDQDLTVRLTQEISLGKPCMLFIDCGGGVVSLGEEIAEAIHYNERVVGVVVNRADSMAIPVLEACRKRVALPEATLFFHSIHASREISAIGTYDHKYVTGLVDEIKSVQELYFDRILRRVHQLKVIPEAELTRDILFEMCRAETRLTANQALSYGLLDAVVPVEKIIRLELLL